MTPEERQLLSGLFDRIKNAPAGDRDKEAEDFISNAMKEQPHAGYMLSQAVIVQEEALKGAVAKIEELESQVQELEMEVETAQKEQAGSGSFLGGIGKSIFGGGDDREAAGDRASDGMRRSGVPSTRGPGSGISVPPRPGAGEGSAWTHQRARASGVPLGAAPGQSRADGGGNSFLKGALGAAAGVAGGMLLANAVGGLFGGKNNPLGIGSANAAEKPSSSSQSPASGDDWQDSGPSSDDDWQDDDGGDDWGDDGGDSDGGDSDGGDSGGGDWE